MKTTKYRRYLMCILLFIISCNTSHSQSPLKDGFYIGAYNHFSFGGLHSPSHFSIYKQLSFNVMQSYSMHLDRDTITPAHRDGGFFDALSTYRLLNMNSVLNIWADSMHNRGLIIEREKVLRAAYGQRSTYQTEVSNPSAQRPGYGYTTRGGNSYSESWQSESVAGMKTSQIDDSSPYYLVKNLYENMEQVNQYVRGDIGNSHNHEYYLSDRKKDPYRWYIKPRMRVDSSYAKNHPTVPVVAVIIKNFSGRTIDSALIKCSDFIDGNGFYNGRYLEMFNFNVSSNVPYPLSVLSDSLLADRPETSAQSPLDQTELSGSQVDYRIYWFGQTDVWLDYVRLDDEWAHFLFTDPEDLLPSNVNKWHFHTKINEEVDWLTTYTGFGYFYMDEYQYDNIPCIAEVNRLIREKTTNATGLLPLLSDWWITQASGLKNPPNYSDAYNFLISKGAVTDILMTDIFPYDDKVPLPDNIDLPDPHYFPGTARYFRSTTYNDDMQDIMENGENYDWGFIPGCMPRFRKTAATIKANPSVIFSLNSQIETAGETNASGTYGQVSRDPLPGEISLENYLGLCYGARHLMHFKAATFTETINSQNYYSWGLLDAAANNTPRENTYYTDPNTNDPIKRWSTITHLDTVLSRTGKAMYNDNKLIYDMTSTVNYTPVSYNPLPQRYITDIKSIYRDNQNSFPEVNLDPADKKYWEIGFFKSDTTISGAANDKSRYFVIVNKRCTPELNDDGDIRKLKIKFSASALPGFTNWKLIDMLTGAEKIFDKNSQGTDGFTDLGFTSGSLGRFNPGEGKLFKLAPVMQEGGMLVADEVTGSSSGALEFDCQDTVKNNGNNITIKLGTTINFETKGRIKMNEHIFYCGLPVTGENVSLPVTLRGKGSSTWSGLYLNQCYGVNIKSTSFSNISSQGNAVFLRDVLLFNIEGCTFNLSGSRTGVNANFTLDEIPDDISPVIKNNIFNVSANTYEPLKLISTGSAVIPAMIDGNTFNTTGSTTASAMVINNISAGVVKNNTITNYPLGINQISSASYCDYYNNHILTNLTGSIGIQVIEGTTNLAEDGIYQTGGYNYLSNEENGTNNNSYNISLRDAIVNLDLGHNTFNLDNINNLDYYHLTGGYHSEDPPDHIDATYNCFQTEGNSSTAGHNVEFSGSIILGGPVNFIFDHSTCEISELAENISFNLGNGLYDTLFLAGEGNGGGYSNKNNKLSISSLKSDYADICIEMRKRHYDLVYDKSLAFINSFADSTQTLDVLSKLYLSALLTDSSGNRIVPVKAVYEGLILNHSSNEKLVNKSFYLIQKCKAALKQYSSALEGFQQIIDQNPLNYTGLVAKWDYMAVHLLDSLNGNGGGERVPGEADKKEVSFEDLLANILNDKEPKISNDEPLKISDDIDKKFSKEERSAIRENISRTLKNDRSSQIDQLKTLKEKEDKGDIKASDELKQKKALFEQVKVRNPKDIDEQMQIINEDIEKVFSKKDSKPVNTNSVPSQYTLSQNYPNPFNPVTKINFELPKEGKVKLIVYDMLGREIAKIVNNEQLNAGRYTYEFNGLNLSSGIYFYRLETVDFVQTKKMVLVK